jgi:hypothetical protein
MQRGGHAPRQLPGLVVAALGQALRCQRHGQHPRSGGGSGGLRTAAAISSASGIGQFGACLELELVDQVVPGEAVVHRHRPCVQRAAVRAGRRRRPAQASPGAARNGRSVALAPQSGPCRPCTGRPGTTAGRPRTARASGTGVGWWPGQPGSTSDQYTARPMAPPPSAQITQRPLDAVALARVSCGACRWRPSRPGCMAKPRAAWPNAWRSSSCSPNGCSTGAAFWAPAEVAGCGLSACATDWR